MYRTYYLIFKDTTEFINLFERTNFPRNSTKIEAIQGAIHFLKNNYKYVPRATKSGELSFNEQHFRIHSNKYYPQTQQWAHKWAHHTMQT